MPGKSFETSLIQACSYFFSRGGVHFTYTDKKMIIYFGPLSQSCHNQRPIDQNLSRRGGYIEYPPPFFFVAQIVSKACNICLQRVLPSMWITCIFCFPRYQHTWNVFKRTGNNIQKITRQRVKCHLQTIQMFLGQLIKKIHKRAFTSTMDSNI